MEIFPSWRYSVTWLGACSGVQRTSRSGGLHYKMRRLSRSKDSEQDVWFEAKPFRLGLGITWQHSRTPMDLHTAQQRPDWDEDEREMTMHSTVNNQPWADWGEGEGSERREGTRSWFRALIFGDFALHPQTSQLLVCHSRHISVEAELSWCLLPAAILRFHAGLKGIVWHFVFLLFTVKPQPAVRELRKKTSSAIGKEKKTALKLINKHVHTKDKCQFCGLRVGLSSGWEPGLPGVSADGLGT